MYRSAEVLYLGVPPTRVIELAQNSISTIF
jgi:hypothetical protein